MRARLRFRRGSRVRPGRFTWQADDLRWLPPAAASELGTTYDVDPTTIRPLGKPADEVDFSDVVIAIPPLKMPELD
jgi:hypothetical protein